jgi:hypothetical protein
MGRRRKAWKLKKKINPERVTRINSRLRRDLCCSASVSLDPLRYFAIVLSHFSGIKSVN